MLFIDCIATAKSKLAIARILRSRLSSLLILVVFNCCCAIDADFDTNNFGGDRGITLKKFNKNLSKSNISNNLFYLSFENNINFFRLLHLFLYFSTIIINRIN